MRSIVTRKNGQSLYIARSIGSLPSSFSFWNPSAMPSQTGRWNRDCVHAKIHGMARSAVTVGFAFRFAGRLPMFSDPSSCAGVACAKYRMNSGVSKTTLRYFSHDSSDMTFMTSRHSVCGDVGGFSECSNVAAVYKSNVWKQFSCSPKFCSITSPCTVTRRRPLIVAGGWDMIARCDGPPPRPTVPPRPWNNVSLTPNSFPTCVAFSCPSYSAHAAAILPASLPESEYPIITSWNPSMCLWYHGTENKRRSCAGPSRKSSRRSKSGATRSKRSSCPPHSRCSKTTARTSDATVAMEMTYVPNDPGQTLWRCPAMWKVSMTSCTSAVHSRSRGTSGRFPSSSATRNAHFFSSSHSLYEPKPMCFVMASIASAWRSLSWRISSRTSDRPKQLTWRIRSSRYPSATDLSPTSIREL
mmetsp:Transcript_6956/g.25587  ORF Transcript_6956/g.25587 Transcript_6956/m.25587 type:complete len:413 (+) Transcript_6956:636-1874(+)